MPHTTVENICLFETLDKLAAALTQPPRPLVPVAGGAEPGVLGDVRGELQRVGGHHRVPEPVAVHGGQHAGVHGLRHVADQEGRPLQGRVRGQPGHDGEAAAGEAQPPVVVGVGQRGGVGRDPALAAVTS